MKISLAVLGLFLAFFFSSQTPTSAFFLPPPSDIFCKYYPNYIFCGKNDNDTGSGNSTSPATPGNSTSNGTTPAEGGQPRSLTPPFGY
uniref:Uncharacterized protein, isoform A n=2 Tax=Drosophila melanogaster TaxID=7227 RepID=M9MS30_DROME|eukprot:NP_001188557.1 uncharacterized protein Dmel_CG42705, isoform A [Drosophila melanogaster]